MMDSKAWDERYAAAELVWSAGPNQLVEEIGRGSVPGRMLDLAAGEGRNAVWFAENGWEATAVDYSTVALAKANEIAARRGVEIHTVEADLMEYEPDVAAYDFVLVAYLHVAPEERALVLRRAAAAVAPGGRLLVIGHDATNLEHGYGGPGDPSVLTSPDEVVAELGEDFVISRSGVVDRGVETEDGIRVAKDTLVLARRVPVG